MSRGKKEKEPKRKKKGLWKMTPLWESKRRGFPQRFGKACWLFHISAQGPVADEPLTINQRRGSLLLDQGGSLLRWQNELNPGRTVFVLSHAHHLHQANREWA